MNKAELKRMIRMEYATYVNMVMIATHIGIPIYVAMRVLI